ncbi:MAG: XRE family transcriptional regulator [Candidatus Aminicenantes bacterium]|nr:MAG: XRE family transcriptional regulator [Candidatus Aminicenantes bacterium]
MNRVREGRFLRKKSQLKLYLESGVTPCVISWIECGRWNATREQQIKLAGALGFEVGWLFPEGDNKQQEDPEQV